MSARVAVPAAPHVLIRKGRGSYHAAVPVRLEGVAVILGSVYRTACGEELGGLETEPLEVWHWEAGRLELERAVETEPAKVCRRCDRVGLSLGETR